MFLWGQKFYNTENLSPSSEPSLCLYLLKLFKSGKMVHSHFIDENKWGQEEEKCRSEHTRGRIQIRISLSSSLGSHSGLGGLKNQSFGPPDTTGLEDIDRLCSSCISTTVVTAWTDSPRWHLRMKSKKSSGRCLETEFGIGLLQKAARCWLRGWWEKSTAFSDRSYFCGSSPNEQILVSFRLNTLKIYTWG